MSDQRNDAPSIALNETWTLARHEISHGSRTSRADEAELMDEESHHPERVCTRVTINRSRIKRRTGHRNEPDRWQSLPCPRAVVHRDSFRLSTSTRRAATPRRTALESSMKNASVRVTAANVSLGNHPRGNLSREPFPAGAIER